MTKSGDNYVAAGHSGFTDDGVNIPNGRESV
jgi:hypothetical protein